MRIKAILFDKDGTLFDFRATWGAWTRRLLSELAGEDAAQTDALARHVGFDPRDCSFAPDSPIIAHTTAEIAEMLLPLLPGWRLPDLIDRMNQLAAATRPVESVPLKPLIGSLSAMGLRLGLATNDGEAPARAHLRQVGVEPMFDFVAGFDSGFGGKPETGQLRAFALHTGLDPAMIAMVGDSRHDLVAGRNAGMHAVAVLTGIAGADELAPFADAVLPDIGHLPGWLADRLVS